MNEARLKGNHPLRVGEESMQQHLVQVSVYVIDGVDLQHFTTEVELGFISSSDQLDVAAGLSVLVYRKSISRD